MFAFWSEERYKDVDVLQEYDFSAPVTRPLVLYAIWKDFIEIPYHVVDTTGPENVLKDDWKKRAAYSIGNSTDIDLAATRDEYIDIQDGYECAFICAAKDESSVDEGRAVSRIYFDQEARTVYVEFANGETAPMASEDEIYFVCHRNPRTISIEYKKISNSSFADASMSSAQRPREFTANSAETVELRDVITSPMAYASSSANYRYFAFAIGSVNASGVQDMKEMTGTYELDADRPSFLARNSWNGIECSLDGGQTWTGCGRECSAYVIYFESQPTLVHLYEFTSGLEEDMSRKFTYDIVVREFNEVITETETQTRWTRWSSWEDPETTYSDPTTNNVHEVQRIDGKTLSNGEVENISMSYTETTSDWNGYTNVSNTRRYRTRTITKVIQKIEIVQRPDSEFTTTNDAGDGAYRYEAYSKDGSNEFDVRFVNSRSEYSVEVHVAEIAGGSIAIADEKWQNAESVFSVKLGPSKTSMGRDEVLDAAADAIFSAVPLDGYEVKGFISGVLDEGNVAEDAALASISLEAASELSGQGRAYAPCVNGDLSLKLGGSRSLFIVVQRSPKIHYVKASGGKLVLLDKIEYDGEPVVMNGYAVLQSEKLELEGASEFKVSPIASGAAGVFQIPTLVDSDSQSSPMTLAYVGVGDLDNGLSWTSGDRTVVVGENGMATSWRADESSEWEDFGETDVFAVYKDRGHDLTVRTALRPERDIYGKYFEVTVQSQNLEPGAAYSVSGSIDAEEVTVDSDRSIRFTLSAGGEAVVYGLPDNQTKYVVAETGMPKSCAFSYVLVDGLPSTHQEEISDGTSIYMDSDKTVELVNAMLFKVKFEDWDGTTLIDYIEYPYGTGADGILMPASMRIREPEGGFIYRFSGWSPSIRPVDSDAVYVAQYRQIKIPSLVQRMDGSSLVVELEDEKTLLDRLHDLGVDLLDPGYDEPSATGFLNETQENGLRRWENLVTGTPSSQHLLDTAHSEEPTTIAFEMVYDPVDMVDLGYDVFHSLHKYDDEAGEWVQIADLKRLDLAGRSTFDVDALGEDGASLNASGFYRVKTVIVPRKRAEIVNVIDSRNIVAVMEVDYDIHNVMTAVPWHGLATLPESTRPMPALDAVQRGQLDAGDSMYFVNASGEHERWTLDESRNWTYAGDGEPTVLELERGSLFWTERADVSRPFFVIGQYTSERDIEIDIPAGTKNDPAVTLVPNPNFFELPLNSIEMLTTPGRNDYIQIPTDTFIPLMIGWKSSYGWYGYVVDPATLRSRAKNDYAVPHGTGFWYINRTGGFKMTVPVVYPTLK